MVLTRPTDPRTTGLRPACFVLITAVTGLTLYPAPVVQGSALVSQCRLYQFTIGGTVQGLQVFSLRQTNFVHQEAVFVTLQTKPRVLDVVDSFVDYHVTLRAPGLVLRLKSLRHPTSFQNLFQQALQF